MNLPTEVRYRPYADWTNEEKTKIKENVAKSPWRAAKPIYFFDFIPVVGYQNSVLPAFFVGLLGAKFEQWVRKWVPDVLDLLLSPLIVFAVMSALALFIIGPVFHTVESYVLAATEWILNLPFGLSLLFAAFTLLRWF